jgi:hypothetical protein
MTSVRASRVYIGPIHYYEQLVVFWTSGIVRSDGNGGYLRAADLM